MQKVQELGKKETRESFEKYEQGRIEFKQRKLLETIRFEIQKAGLFLKQTVDTLDIVRDLARSKKSFEIVQDGITSNSGSHYSQRNLAVSDAILEQVALTLEEHRLSLDNYYNSLSGYRYTIDSLSSDSVLYSFPNDSVQAVKYLRTMVASMKEAAPVDSLITVAVANIQKLLQEVDLFLFEVHTSRNDIEKINQHVSPNLLEREFPNIWEPPLYKRPVPEILAISIKKEKLALQFYIKDNAGRLLLLVLILLAVTFFLDSLKQRLKAENSLHPAYEAQVVIRYPVMSAFVITISLFQFIFLDPPFIVSYCLWFIAAICLSVLFYRYITGFWMWFWVVMVISFAFASLDNMLLQASRIERWCMVGLQLFGIAYGLYILKNKHRVSLREHKILYFVGIFVFIEVFSLLFNLFGRYNLSKTLLIIGFSGLVVAILFLWTLRLLNEGLSIASQVYQHPDKKLFYINFAKVGDQVPRIFYVFLAVGWAILMGRNFYAFRTIAGPLNSFLNEQRKLGDYSFSINGIVIFALILIVSLFLSRLISFFATEPDLSQGVADRKGKVEVGSWLLLIRIIIISTGLFLAIAAAGIPLDRITLVIGALGVGIGLGLQGLVNNLVSGLIIAFEKPVNVGDIIEVDGKSGTMKSIGFRSSVVVTSDGSSLIIPNGDLLSQHLVNWTMSRNRKRINLVIGVAYGTDIAQAQQLIQEIMRADSRISYHPPAIVLARNFAANTIDLDVFFWMNDLREASLTKSDLIQKIDQRFKEAGIVIPIPQQEILIRQDSSVPSPSKHP